jgi:hypothetical protein
MFRWDNDVKTEFILYFELCRHNKKSVKAKIRMNTPKREGSEMEEIDCRRRRSS